MTISERLGFNETIQFFMDNFGMRRGGATAATLFVGVVVVLAVFWFFYSAPPYTLTMTSGPEGSIFRTTAEKYRSILAQNGVKLRILASQGSRQNLERLANRAFPIDVGLVQGGVADSIDIGGVVSLGAIAHEPLLVFYRSAKPVDLLSEFEGMRLAIGPAGSGTRPLVLNLLSLNGIEPGGRTSFVDLEAEAAAAALIAGKIDVAFLMADFASVDTIHNLLLTPGIRIFDFTQADAYTRRVTYLTTQVLPQGAIDFGKNVPRRDVTLVGPTVELLARPSLHPALSDLLLEAATEVNGRAGLFKRQGEFPAPLVHEYPISADAKRFYKSGRSFLYRYLPFWVASLVNRIVVAFVPMVVVLFPLLRVAPALFRLRMKLRINRWYRSLLMIEKDVLEGGAKNRIDLPERIDRIEREVNKMKVPASFGDQFYVLRQHIRFVHDRLTETEHSH